MSSHLPGPASSSSKPAAPRAPRGLHSWLLARLDSLLSEPLRNTTPSQLTRNRVVVGAGFFMGLFALVGLSVMPLSSLAFINGSLGLGYAGVVLLARKARSPRGPVTLLCTTLVVGYLACSFFLVEAPYLSTNAAQMLVPAFAVYLMGARLGLAVTVIFIVGHGILNPLYQVSVDATTHLATDPYYWPMHAVTIFALIGIWLLGTLHDASRDDVQQALERTLKELRESQGQLSSLFESTGDLVCSLDPQGRIFLANTAMKQAHRERFGKKLEPGDTFFALGAPEHSQRWEQRLAQAREGQPLRFEEEYTLGGQSALLDISVHPIHGEGGQVAGMTLFARDITARKQAELRLGEMHRTLVDVSRHAGMAEIATGVLHNVGNTLNSVNISVNLISEQLRQSRQTGLARVAKLLREHSGDFTAFWQDPQGKKLPPYLITLADQLREEREIILKELGTLTEGVEHIKSIVSMQQKHARAVGAQEHLAIPQLIDEALRLHAVSFERLGISIEREYNPVPLLFADRHKLLQILVNLMSNARHALVDSAQQDKRLRIRVQHLEDSQRIRVALEDNGVGVAPEILPRLFTQGFTTKKTGHGFGLHISALAAGEMKGKLSCESQGLGHGATFTLELPVEATEPQAA